MLFWRQQPRNVQKNYNLHVELLCWLISSYVKLEPLFYFISIFFTEAFNSIVIQICHKTIFVPNTTKIMNLMRAQQQLMRGSIQTNTFSEGKTYLILNSSSEAGNRLNEGSICDTREADGTFDALLNCWRRDHRSLYSRSSLGYSPSNACFKNVEATKRRSPIVNIY